MIKLILIVLLFLISLLAVYKAPAYYLWLLAIGVTEYPLLFAGITTVVLVAGIWIEKYQLASTIIGVLALVLFLTPIIRAYIVSTSLKEEFITAFGPASAVINGNNSVPPFRFFKLFSTTPQVAYKTVTYNTDKAVPLAMDYYPAALDGKRPCVIVVHGGSWSSGDSKQLPELNSYLAAEGYNVAAINYRMAPKYQTPAPVEDIRQVIAYLKNHAEELKIDVTKLVLLGRSAGAQIALLSAYTQKEPGLRGVVDFYGPADMVWGYSIPSNPLIMDSRKVMENYIGGSYPQVPKKYLACSPLEFVDSTSVPTLIIHGNNDVLVAPEHSRRLNKKLGENHIPHFWLQLPWATHGFDYNLNGPGGQISTYVVERFISTVTK